MKLTLKELYAGTTKKLKVTRRVYNKETNKLEEKEVCQRAPDSGIWRLSLSFLRCLAVRILKYRIVL